PTRWRGSPFRSWVAPHWSGTRGPPGTPRTSRTSRRWGKRSRRFSARGGPLLHGEPELRAPVGLDGKARAQLGGRARPAAAGPGVGDRVGPPLLHHEPLGDLVDARPVEGQLQ